MVVELGVDLVADEVGARDGEWVEQLMPQGVGHDQHVVGWRVGLRTDGRADRLEQRIGLGDVDDAVDLHADRSESGASDGDGVTGWGREVGGGLLEQQHSFAGADEISELGGRTFPDTAG